MLAGSTFNSTLDRMLTLNRVLDEALASSWNGSDGDHAWVPSIDAVERPDAWQIAIEVPGVDPSTIDVSFEKNTLTVRGEKAPGLDVKNGDARIHAAERVTGAFRRSVRLPESVDADRISAESRHGVLFLTVPKATTALPRKIQIATR